MTTLTEKIASVLPSLEERGAVYIFAFAEREDVDRWDVVLCSAWSDKDWAASIRFVVNLLWPLLEPWERTMISRVAVVPSSDPRVQEMPESLNGIVPEDEKVIYASLLGSDIRRAFIFKAQHPPTVTSKESLVGAASA